MNLLTKGLEEEVYTGRSDGQVVALSNVIAQAMPEYHTEPDARNVEFATEPFHSYDCLIGDLMDKRMRLRRWLQDHGDHTLVQGATLSLETSDQFHIADENNPYYRFIRDAYGVHVVTASSHLNVGVEDVETLFRAYRLIRSEAPLFLALSAASPFLKGRATGQHSSRWSMFPHTPKNVPLFENHAQFTQWVKDQLKEKNMFNARHLWASARPNGAASPHDLNRLELRICDRVSDVNLLQGLLALLEVRVRQVIEDPSLDPLHLSHHPAATRADDLVAEALANERAVAKSSLDAQLMHWRTGEKLSARDWIAQLIAETRPTAKAHGFENCLDMIRPTLKQGNTAQQWLKRLTRGQNVQQIIERANHRISGQDIETPYTIC